MEKSTLWTRVNGWIKHPRRSMGWNSIETGVPPVEKVDSYSLSGDNVHASPGNGHRRTWLSFGSNRRNSEEQSRQISELVRALQTQAERQTKVAENANANLERLIGSLAVIPTVMQTQQEALIAIQRRLEMQSTSQKQLEEVVDHLGDISEAVRESSVAFAAYSEVARQSGERVTSELQQQGQAVAQLAQSVTPMARAVNDLRFDIGSRGEDLTQCVSQLNRKLVQFASATLILALIAAIIGVVALLR